MKRKNAVSDFSSQRNTVLLNNFREKLAKSSRKSVKQLFEETAETPAPRFWVSEERAAAVVGALLRGEDPTTGMFPEKREMFLEIYARFLDLRPHRPDTSILNILQEVVNEPAPRHYLSAERVRRLVNAEKQRRRQLLKAGIISHVVSDSGDA